MQAKLQILKLFQKSLAPKPCKIIHISPKYLSTITESSNLLESTDLPAWLFDTGSPRPTDPDDDDFVIPSLASWVESKKLEADKTDTIKLLSEVSDCDIDQVSEILLKHHQCNGSVVEALNKRGLRATGALVSQLLKRFSNHWATAIGIFTWAKKQTDYVHSPELYNVMIDILGKCKKFCKMWELVEEMNSLDGYVSLVTMTKVMRRLARAGKHTEAIEAFRGMEEKFGVRKDIAALTVLIDSLVKEVSVENAYSAFVEFRDGVSLDLNVFNILVHGYCKARMLDDARRTMDEMEIFGCRPDVVTYTSLVEAYTRDRDFRNVNAILNEMKEKGCKPNVVTYTILMHGLGKAKQINEALEVYEEMKKEGCVSDAKFYSSFIYLLSQSGRLKDAWAVFEDMEKQGVRRVLWTYNTMIAAVCAHSQDESAFKLLQRMKGDSCEPDVTTYAPLLKLCCRRKNMKMLKFLLKHMFENDVSIDLATYVLLIKGLCKCGRLEHACFFFQEMVSKEMVPYDSTYKLLVAELERKEMTEMKEKMEKLMSSVQGKNV